MPFLNNVIREGFRQQKVIILNLLLNGINLSMCAEKDSGNRLPSSISCARIECHKGLEKDSGNRVTVLNFLLHQQQQPNKIFNKYHNTINTMIKEGFRQQRVTVLNLLLNDNNFPKWRRRIQAKQSEAILNLLLIVRIFILRIFFSRIFFLRIFFLCGYSLCG